MAVLAAMLCTGEAFAATYRWNADAERHMTIHVDELPGLEATSAATTIRSDNGLPLAVERTMFWNESRYGGHTDAAVPGPSQSDTDAQVNITYLRENGTPIVRPYSVPRTSRVTVDVGGLVTELQNELFGAAIEVTNGVGIAVERAMYWNSNGIFLAGGTGATATRLP